MVQRSLVDLYGDPCRVRVGVEIVGKPRAPITEAVGGIGEALEITVGSPTQRFLGSRGLVLERLQLGDLVHEISEVAILSAGNLGAVVQVSIGRRTGDQSRR